MQAGRCLRWLCGFVVAFPFGFLVRKAFFMESGWVRCCRQAQAGEVWQAGRHGSNIESKSLLDVFCSCGRHHVAKAMNFGRSEQPNAAEIRNLTAVLLRWEANRSVTVNGAVQRILRQPCYCVSEDAFLQFPRFSTKAVQHGHLE